MGFRFKGRVNIHKSKMQYLRRLQEWRGKSHDRKVPNMQGWFGCLEFSRISLRMLKLTQARVGCHVSGSLNQSRVDGECTLY